VKTSEFSASAQASLFKPYQTRPNLETAVLGKVLPLLLLGLLVVAALVGNLFVGISWQQPTVAQIALMAAALGSISLYARIRAAQRLSEASAFLLFYIAYPLFGIRLSYLAASIGLPAADQYFHRLDAMLGFDWQAWARFEEHHPQWLHVQALLYQSHLAQVFLLAIVFSFIRPGSRNYEMLFLLLSSLFVAIGLMALFPTIGPASLAHMAARQETILNLLRSGHHDKLPYDGVISFPSYHTIMAIIFVYCARGLKLLFVPLLVWNAAMLFTIPYGGDHYVSDMIAGAAIAALCIAGSRAIYPMRSQA
jgi:membrane-associated phospholipid phosphatase